MHTAPAPLFEVETRICTGCHVERPMGMFYLDAERRREIRLHCRFCQRDQNNRQRKPKQDYVDAVKLSAGCADCGIRSVHPEIYDLDHLPGAEKSASVAQLLTRGTMEDLVAEIAKCEVVCANCHRIRTRARGHSSFGTSWSAGR